MREMVRGWLGIPQIESDVEQITQRVESLAKTAENQSSEFGSYKKKTNDELHYVLGSINSLISQLEELADQNLTEIDIKRVKAELRKLRYNRTMMNNTLSGRG